MKISEPRVISSQVLHKPYPNGNTSNSTDKIAFLPLNSGAYDIAPLRVAIHFTFGVSSNIKSPVPISQLEIFITFLLSSLRFAPFMYICNSKDLFL